jgi:hypothetical protein
MSIDRVDGLFISWTKSPKPLGTVHGVELTRKVLPIRKDLRYALSSCITVSGSIFIILHAKMSQNTEASQTAQE